MIDMSRSRPPGGDAPTIRIALSLPALRLLLMMIRTEAKATVGMIGTGAPPEAIDARANALDDLTCAVQAAVMDRLAAGS
jgi:hypothetical protein